MAEGQDLLGAIRNHYDAAVAVGDVFSLMMAYRARAGRTVYAGTAKSVYVAPYGAAYGDGKSPAADATLRIAPRLFARRRGVK